MATSRLLISGGAVISMDPKIGDFVNADVLVVDGKIAEIGPNLEVGDCETFDASECIVMPGLIDTHRHTWQAPWRNIGGDWTLFHYLKGLHTGLSKHYRPEDTYAGNLLGSQSERGHWFVVAFLYTHCPDVCPLIANNLGIAMRKLPDLRVLAISVTVSHLAAGWRIVR